MNNADVRYRYYNPWDPNNAIRIAFSDKITKPYFFKTVIEFGISQIIKELIIDYDIESYSSWLWIFGGNSGDFKVSWELENNTIYRVLIGYYVNNNILDQKVLYDIVTYEDALDFIQNYISDILTNGVPQAAEPEYDEDALTELKLMHGVMQSMNNEDAYYSWIVTGVPDGAIEDDYIDIASDPEELTTCKQVFDNVFSDYASDGLFDPTPEEAAYAKQVCQRLGLPEIEILNRP